MAAGVPPDLTLGEVARGLGHLADEVAQLRRTVDELKIEIAREGVRLGILWGAAALAGGAMLTSLVAATIAILRG